MNAKFGFILLLFWASAACAASKEGEVKRGNALYQKGEFDSSLKNYENALKADPQSPAINFNLGTALYKNKKYDEAVLHLQKGLLSDDVLVKKNAHFNLGDTLYAQGVNFGEKHVDQAISALEESLRQFNAVLNIDDKDSDAQYNRDIVQKELELLKKKKQQQDQQNQQNQNKDQESNKADKKQDQKQSQEQEKKSAGSLSDKDKPSESPSQSENKDAEDKKEEQKPEQGFSQGGDQKQKEDKSSDEKSQASVAPKRGEMTKEEANALLKQFEQSPESGGLLNFDKHTADEPAVLKDW